MHYAVKKLKDHVNTYCPSFTPRRVVIVGCGGIGSHLLPLMARETFYRAYCSLEHHSTRTGLWPEQFLLIDADIVEEKNLFRQDFSTHHINSPKSDALAERYRPILSKVNVNIESKREWIDKVGSPFVNHDAVMMCVDNNATRLIVNDIFMNPESCINSAHLISGGNTGNLATVHLLSKEYGDVATAPLTYLQPDIANPDDKHPKDESCMDVTSFLDDPQVFRANQQAATIMNNVFWQLMDRKPVDYCQIWSDVGEMTFRKEPIPARGAWLNG